MCARGEARRASTQNDVPRRQEPAGTPSGDAATCKHVLPLESVAVMSALAAMSMVINSTELALKIGVSSFWGMASGVVNLAMENYKCASQVRESQRSLSRLTLLVEFGFAMCLSSAAMTLLPRRDVVMISRTVCGAKAVPEVTVDLQAGRAAGEGWTHHA